MSHILHRNPSFEYPVAVWAQGMSLKTSDGRTFLDACGGAAVSSLGHGHPAVVAAIKHQLDVVAYAHTSFFTTAAAEDLAAELIAHAPAGISKAYFVSGGSEATETALKLARQYHVERGEPQRQQIIARRLSYHGNTSGALAISGHERRRAQFDPLLFKATHVSPCYEYRERRADETPEAYGTRLAQELEDEIQLLGTDRVIAFVAETIGGATAGALLPVPNYFKQLREICSKHNVLLILDEVMCGMGRTGTLHACEQEGVVPDILTVAKGLGGGYAPIGAVLVSKHIDETIRTGSGTFQHGFTYVGHSVSAAAALAVQRVIREENLLQNVKEKGDYLGRRLRETFGNHPFVGDIRGRGLFWALELVADRGTKTTFSPQLNVNGKIKTAAMEQGLMTYPMGGTSDGLNGDHILLAPPYIATETDIDMIVERLQASMAAVLSV